MAELERNGEKADMLIAMGSDHLGFKLKETLKAYLTGLGIQVADYGSFTDDPVDYPDIAFRVCDEIASGRFDRAILVCGTGNGMTIAANKVPGIRAALCHDVYSAERARKSNNAQILTMGGLIVNPETAKTVVDAWIVSEFEGGPSTRKVQKIIDKENQSDGE